MTPRLLRKCIALRADAREACRENSTNPLLSSHLAADFHACGITPSDDDNDTYDDPETHWIKVQNAERDIQMYFDRNTLTSLSDVYGSASGKLSPTASPYQGKAGRPQKTIFGANSHPDDGAKQIVKVSVHRFHIVVPNGLHYACEKTHTEFKLYPGAAVKTWIENQGNTYRKKTLKTVNLGVHRTVLRNGGFEAWVQAGYPNRIEAFYKIFDSAPANTTNTVFSSIADAYDIENINGGGPDSSLAKACRDFDRYKFGELMEDAFWARRAPLDGDSKHDQQQLFLSMCSSSNPNIEHFGLPQDWRDLPGKCRSDDEGSWGGYPEKIAKKSPSKGSKRAPSELVRRSR